MQIDFQELAHSKAGNVCVCVCVCERASNCTDCVQYVTYILIFIISKDVCVLIRQCLLSWQHPDEDRGISR